MNYYANKSQLEVMQPQQYTTAFCKETGQMYYYEPNGALYTVDGYFVLQTGFGGNTRWLSMSLAATPPGTIIDFAGPTPPGGFLLCDGSAISRTMYANLFNAIGTTWGSGDGSTTFNLPDLRGIFRRGAGSHGTLQKANGNPFDGGAVGQLQNDMFQGHWHEGWGAGMNTGSRVGSVYSGGLNITPQPGDAIQYPKPDNINGPTRGGDETRPANATILPCIKF